MVGAAGAADRRRAWLRWRSRSSPAAEATSRPRSGDRRAAPRLAELPGIMLAAIATIGLGVVLGPEAPLIALGSGLGLLAIRLVRTRRPTQVLTLVAAAGTLRRAVVRLQLAADRRGHPDRGHRHRRPAAAADPAARAAGRRDRLAGLARHGVVHGPQHQGLRARRAAAAEVRPPSRRQLRLDDRAGIVIAAGTRVIMRGGLGRPAAIADPRPLIAAPGRRPGDRRLWRSLFSQATGHTSTTSCSPARTSYPAWWRGPGLTRWARWRC